MDRGDFQGAERVLRELKGSEASFQLGKFLAERGRGKEARRILVKLLSDRDHKTAAFRLLAQGSMEYGDWESARAHLLDLEKAEPQDPGVAKALADCLIRLGDSLGALSAAQRGLALAPDDRDLAKLMSDAAEAAAASAARTHAGLPKPRTQRDGRRMR